MALIFQPKNSSGCPLNQPLAPLGLKISHISRKIKLFVHLLAQYFLLSSGCPPILPKILDPDALQKEAPEEHTRPFSKEEPPGNQTHSYFSILSPTMYKYQNHNNFHKIKFQTLSFCSYNMTFARTGVCNDWNVYCLSADLDYEGMF